jgi:inner membrane protein
MDSLTQIVLGAAIGEAVLGKKVGNKAQLYGAIAGTIPDLDIFASHFSDTITATEIHRGFSHSIVFALMASPILGWLVNKLERKLNLGWKSWTWLFFWGIFTHPLLDSFTTWGTQLFWPLENRLAFNSIFVIDPLYTIPFLVCTIWAMCKKRGTLSRKRINLTGIILSTSYLLLTIPIKWAAGSKFQEALDSQGISYEEISTRPAAFNTVLWNANIDAGNAYLLGDYSFFDTQPISFRRYEKNRDIRPTLPNPESEKNLERLIDITNGWYLMEQKEGEWYFYDLRFGTMPISNDEEQFVFTYKLFYDQENILQAEEIDKASRDGKYLLKQLWNRIQGN